MLGYMGGGWVAGIPGGYIPEMGWVYCRGGGRYTRRQVYQGWGVGIPDHNTLPP